jgi:flagellar motor protein MotB
MAPDQIDIRQDTSYRKGLLLGLTMAEVMILLVFILLMALGSVLAARDKEIRVIKAALDDAGGVQQAYGLLQQAFPEAETPEDFFKEITRLQEKALRQSEELDRLRALEDALTLETQDQAAERAFYKMMETGARKENADLPTTLAESRALFASQKRANDKTGHWPPFISLSEADGYFFDSGSARLKPEFQTALSTTTVDVLTQIVTDYGVDVIEVIGHTDEVPMRGRSTLDDRLIAAVRGEVPIGLVRSADNAGLGMARAVSVVGVLKEAESLKDVKILPLSGAQMIVPVDQLSDGTDQRSVAERRRIEIRVRRSTEQAPVSSGDQ